MVESARIAKGWTQKRLAKAIGVCPTYISKVESDRVRFRRREHIVDRICEVLQVDKDESLSLSGQISLEERRAMIELFELYGDSFVQFMRAMQDPRIAESVFQLLE